MGYGYNAAGQLQTLTLPSGNTIGYGYNQRQGHEPDAQRLDHDSLGRALRAVRPDHRLDLGQQHAAVRDFDTDGKVTHVDIANGASLKNYGYDDAFRITGITDAADRTLSWSYGYDCSIG